LADASVAWRLRLCSVSKEASHAGHEWRPRDETLDGATDRERFDNWDLLSCISVGYQTEVG